MNQQYLRTFTKILIEGQNFECKPVKALSIFSEKSKKSWHGGPLCLKVPKKIKNWK